MAGNPITFIGKMTKADGTVEQVQLDGIAGTPGLDVGIPLPPSGPPGVVAPPIYYPPGIWGPTDPRPTPPIYIPSPPPVGIWPPPGVVAPPIYYPPGIWGPTDPRPTPPIHLPEPEPPPTEPPIAPPGGGLSEGWQWFYTPGYGFVLVWLPPGGGGKPQPPGGEAPVATPYKK